MSATNSRILLSWEVSMHYNWDRLYGKFVRYVVKVSPRRCSDDVEDGQVELGVRECVRKNLTADREKILIRGVRQNPNTVNSQDPRIRNYQPRILIAAWSLISFLAESASTHNIHHIRWAPISDPFICVYVRSRRNQISRISTGCCNHRGLKRDGHRVNIKTWTTICNA